MQEVRNSNEPMPLSLNEKAMTPGSVLIFTESVIHATNNWTNPDNPRCAVFNCYNSIWAQWFRLNLSHEIIEKMLPKRQSLFRGTWAIGGSPGGNRQYPLDNATK